MIVASYAFLVLIVLYVTFLNVLDQIYDLLKIVKRKYLRIGKFKHFVTELFS